jgi:hypothetical protein
MEKETKSNKQQFKDIDVRAYIDGFTGAEMPNPAQTNIPTGTNAEMQSPETEEKPKEPPKRKRGADYEMLFLTRNEIRNRQGLYIDRENYETLQMLVRAIRSERLSVSGLVDNIVRNHIKQYEEEINRVYEENVRKPIKNEKLWK